MESKIGGNYLNQIKLIEIPYTNLRQINNDYLKLLLEEYL